MTPTLFGALWAPLVLLYCWNPTRLLQLAVFGSIFQGAAVAEQGTGFDGFAIGPALLPAVLFIGHGLLRAASKRCMRGERDILRLLMPLLLLLAYAVLSGYFLPRLFENSVYVWPPRGDSAQFSAQALSPSRGNITQSFYIIVHVLLTLFTAFYVIARPKLQVSLVWTYIVSGLVVLCLGLWELASHLTGVFYPSVFLHSNASITVMAGSEMGGVSRISGPFTEASFLAMFLSGTLFCCVFLILRGYRHWAVSLLGIGSFVMILLSTATTGLVTIALLPVVVLTMPLFGPKLPGLRKVGIGAAVASLLFLAGAATLPSVAPQFMDSVQDVAAATLRKTSSESYDIRSRQDEESLALPLETYGLGAGWGSVRASSLIATLAGGVGVPGLALCMWLAISLGRRVVAAAREPLSRNQRFVIDAASGALFGNLIAAAVAVPDLDAMAFYIILGGLAACLTGAGHERSAMRFQPRDKVTAELAGDDLSASASSHAHSGLSS